MNFQVFCRVLLATALLLITSTKASPYHGLHARYSNLKARDLVINKQCTDFVTGAKNDPVEPGTPLQVCVSSSGSNIVVTYPTLTSCTYNEVHVWIGLSTDPLPGRNPGGFPYSDKNVCTISPDRKSVTCTIPIKPEWLGCNKQFKIVTHAALTCGGSAPTAWGMGPCFPDTSGNCPKVWTFTAICRCPVVSFFPQQYSTTTITSTSTSTTTYITSTTVVYPTSTTSLYTTSTTIVFDTSTTSEYPVTSYPEYTTTTTSTSTLPRSSIIATISCDDPNPTTITIGG